MGLILEPLPDRWAGTMGEIRCTMPGMATTLDQPASKQNATDPRPQGALAQGKPVGVRRQPAGVLDRDRSRVWRCRRHPVPEPEDHRGQPPRPGRGGAGHSQPLVHQALRAAVRQADPGRGAVDQRGGFLATPAAALAAGVPPREGGRSRRGDGRVCRADAGWAGRTGKVSTSRRP